MAKPNSIHSYSSLEEKLVKETVDHPPSVFNPVVAYKIHVKCKNILLVYERLKNLDVCIQGKIFIILKQRCILINNVNCDFNTGYNLFINRR